MASSPQARGPLSLFGFPVRVSPFFFLLVAMLNPPSSWEMRGLLQLAIWISVAVVAVLWHELGHAFAMRYYGYSPSIELYGMGGLTRWGGGPNPTASQRLVVSVAGPLAGLLLGLLVLAAGAGVQLGIEGEIHWALVVAFEYSLGATFVWSIINLVPMVPWDGGHALHAFLDLVTKGRGAKPTAVVTMVVGTGLLFFVALVLREIWLSILVILSLAAGWRLWRGADEAVQARPVPAQSLGGLRDALAKMGLEKIVAFVLSDQRDPGWENAGKAIEKDVLARELSIGGRAHTLELAAWAHLLGGDTGAAQRALDRMPTTHDPSAALEALVAAKLQHFEDALASASHMDSDEETAARARIETHALIGLGRIEDVLAKVGTVEDRDEGSYAIERLFRAEKYDAASTGAEKLFARFSHPEDAYNAACSHARAGRPLDAFKWIERAIDAGYRDIEHLDNDEDLASIRSLPEFARLRERARANS